MLLGRVIKGMIRDNGSESVAQHRLAGITDPHERVILQRSVDAGATIIGNYGDQFSSANALVKIAFKSLAARSAVGALIQNGAQSLPWYTAFVSIVQGAKFVEVREGQSSGPALLTGVRSHMVPRYVAGAFVVTKELLQAGDSEEWLETECETAVGRGLDSLFSADMSPGSSYSEAATSDFASDFRNLLDITDLTGSAKLVAIPSVKLCHQLSMLTKNGQRVCPFLEATGGTVAGVPFYPTDQVADGSLMLCDASGLIINLDQLQLTIATDAAVEQAVPPTGESVPANPVQLTSLWQTNSVAIGVTARFAWELLRENAISQLTGAAYTDS